MTDPALPTQPDIGKRPRPGRAARSPLVIALFVLVTALICGADLYLKHWSFETVANRPVELTPQVIDEHEAFWRQYPHDPTVVIPSLLNLQLTTNPGAVFGLGKGGRYIFIVVSVVAIFIISVMFARSPARAWLLHLALSLILAGAMGNLYDRVVYGAVRDMLHMLPGTGIWPWIFNLADAALMAGVGLVLVLTFLNDRQTTAAKRAAPQPTPEA